MSAPLLICVSPIYIGVAISYGLKGNGGMAVAFVAYAVANVGLILGAK